MSVERFFSLQKQKQKNSLFFLSFFYTLPLSLFSAAEVVVALQYLHLMGVVYRDLKPENILLHSDGHVALADFDLSHAGPPPTPQLKEVASSSSAGGAGAGGGGGAEGKRGKGGRGAAGAASAATAAGAAPAASGASSRASASSPSSSSSRRKGSSGGSGRHSSISSSHAAAEAAAAALRRSRVVVAEPTDRANSFVGTEEYLAPEVIAGTGHGPPVDWWSLGVLIYELVYGFTPFRASKRDATFDAILTRPLAFPPRPAVSPQLQDLVSRLLERDERSRLGSVSGSGASANGASGSGGGGGGLGAEEVKAHPWFEGIDWALLRHMTPPHVPSSSKAAAPPPGNNNVEGF